MEKKNTNYELQKIFQDVGFLKKFKLTYSDNEIENAMKLINEIDMGKCLALIPKMYIENVVKIFEDDRYISKHNKIDLKSSKRCDQFKNIYCRDIQVVEMDRSKLELNDNINHYTKITSHILLFDANGILMTQILPNENSITHHILPMYSIPGGKVEISDANRDVDLDSTSFYDLIKNAALRELEEEVLFTHEKLFIFEYLRNNDPDYIYIANPIYQGYCMGNLYDYFGTIMCYDLSKSIYLERFGILSNEPDKSIAKVIPFDNIPQIYPLIMNNVCDLIRKYPSLSYIIKRKILEDIDTHIDFYRYKNS